MKSIDALRTLMQHNADPTIADYVERVIGVLATTTRLAMDGRNEDLELLVIAVQDFAGERARVLQTQRLCAERETQELLHNLQKS